MAGNFDDDKEGKPLRDLTSDSGLGNLPPLSDFDSHAGAAFDSDGLPPLGNFGSGGGARGITPSEDDLSAISDLDVETPGVGTDLYSSGGAVNTPSSPSPATGFQDLAADSDFSPETPEIGPGPDSNLDTPMFDSAFGGGSQFDRNMRASLDTPAPTQAMETPMFGASSAPRASGGGGFGDDGFDLGGPMGGGFGGFDGGGAVGGGFNMGGGGGGLDFDAGTPAPDFSPDTRAPMTGNDGKKGKGGGGGGQSTGTLVGVGVAALVVGILATSLFLSPYIPEMINPTLAAKNAAEADAAASKQQIAAANQRAAKAEAVAAELQKRELENPGGGNVTEELSKVQEELTRVTGELEAKTADLQAIERDVLAKNEEFLQAQQMYEDLKNETSITQARQKGLIAEIERLTTYTGELEEANKRRIETRDSLAHAVDRLIIQIQEGMPLTPEKYSHQSRVAAAQALRDQIESSNWVSPEIQEAYNKLYLTELEIGQANEYFFAKLRVTDEFGNKANKWAECLMQGNWSVAYRTLDGKNIGEYANLAAPGEPVRWGFREDLPQDVKVNLEQKVFASRVEGFEEKIAVIAAKQLAAEEGTAFQAAFSSL